MEDFVRPNWPPMTNMENVLHRINWECISVSKRRKHRKGILSSLVQMFIKKMKATDRLFATLYNRIFYGGSYYDGLKVGEPDEYDLDLLMRFPEKVRYQISNCDRPGFLKLRIENPELLGEEFQRKLMQDNYLSPDLLRRWMEGLIMTILGQYPYENGYYQLSVSGYRLKAKMHKSGPAMTLDVMDWAEKIHLDIDLVPCFEFDVETLPDNIQWKTNLVSTRNTFFIVPKPPKDIGEKADIYWRMSFQEQERVLIFDKHYLKPAMKLIKRIRDVEGYNSIISSYYIKTIFLKMNESNGPSYWHGSLTDVFLKTLRLFIEHLEGRRIAYFWNPQLNLLTVSEITLSNITTRLRAILDGLERNRVENPKAICQYFDYKL